MIILELYQNDYSKDLVAFDSLEEGKAFVAQIPGYTLEIEDGFEVEYVNPKYLPDYMEIVFNKVIEGATKIDAYVVNNDEVKAYIEARETKYHQSKAFLESKGYEVDRSYFGSEDGEAIVYRKKDTEDWHFLCHLDPSFVEIEDVEGYIKEAMEYI